MQQTLTDAVGQRKVETKGPISDTKDNGDVAEGGIACDRGPRKVASVKSSRRRWPLGGSWKDRFHSNRQSLCIGSWGLT